MVIDIRLADRWSASINSLFSTAETAVAPRWHHPAEFEFAAGGVSDRMALPALTGIALKNAD
jgi:hypothetical protein